MRIFFVGSTLALAALLAGCVVVERNSEVGPLQTSTFQCERGRAETVRMDVRMSVGELNLREASAGSSKLLDAEFQYNLPFVKPRARYDDAGIRGYLTVSQEGERNLRLGGDMKNIWNLRVQRDVPLDLDVHLGVGESRLDLGQLALRKVEVHMGVGECHMDLRGAEPQRDYTVSIHGGVGEAVVYLPKGVGVVADAKGGLGELQVEGNLKKDGRQYLNDLYGRSKVTVRLDIRGGIGSIRLIG
ncbi:MAG: toast rack family protein [Acidobacteria bacterium]|nr:toast rack family protein [Acidobacteriota bacterium]